jgi:hypothetical protein
MIRGGMTSLCDFSSSGTVSIHALVVYSNGIKSGVAVQLNPVSLARARSRQFSGDKEVELIGD